MIAASRDDAPSEPPRSALARLSRDAIRHAVRLRGSDYGRLQSRLYFYNRVPFSERWRVHFGGTVPDWRRFGLAQDSRCWSGWRTSSGAATGWTRFVRPRQRRVGVGAKLYLSPVAERMPEVLKVAAPALAATECISFKFGSDVPGLLRPDKFIAYFPTADDMFAAASVLDHGLGDLPAQGAPFTAQFGSSPLVSWGIDPPAPERAETASTSWRLWVCSQIAAVLVDASPERVSDDEAERLVYDALAAHGIDAERWRPANVIPPADGPRHER